MIPVIIKGLITGGFSFAKEWWEGKQEESKRELELKQEEKRTEQQLRLLEIQAQVSEDGERVNQMRYSWKDEFWLIVFSIPLLNMFLSPFVDLMMLPTYEKGMLANAASEALSNLDNAPDWYVVIIFIMCCLSWGYRKGIDQLLGIFTRKSK